MNKQNPGAHPQKKIIASPSSENSGYAHFCYNILSISAFCENIAFVYGCSLKSQGYDNNSSSNSSSSNNSNNNNNNYYSTTTTATATDTIA